MTKSRSHGRQLIVLVLLCIFITIGLFAILQMEQHEVSSDTGAESLTRSRQGTSDNPLASSTGLRAARSMAYESAARDIRDQTSRDEVRAPDPSADPPGLVGPSRCAFSTGALGEDLGSIVLDIDNLPPEWSGAVVLVRPVTDTALLAKRLNSYGGDYLPYEEAEGLRRALSDHLFGGSVLETPRICRQVTLRDLAPKAYEISVETRVPLAPPQVLGRILVTVQEQKATQTALRLADANVDLKLLPVTGRLLVHKDWGEDVPALRVVPSDVGIGSPASLSPTCTLANTTSIFREYTWSCPQLPMGHYWLEVRPMMVRRQLDTNAAEAPLTINAPALLTVSLYDQSGNDISNRAAVQWRPVDPFDPLFRFELTRIEPRPGAQRFKAPPGYIIIRGLPRQEYYLPPTEIFVNEGANELSLAVDLSCILPVRVYADGTAVGWHPDSAGGFGIAFTNEHGPVSPVHAREKRGRTLWVQLPAPGRYLVHLTKVPHSHEIPQPVDIAVHAGKNAELRFSLGEI